MYIKVRAVHTPSDCQGSSHSFFLFLHIRSNLCISRFYKCFIMKCSVSMQRCIFHNPNLGMFKLFVRNICALPVIKNQKHKFSVFFFVFNMLENVILLFLLAKKKKKSHSCLVRSCAVPYCGRKSGYFSLFLLWEMGLRDPHRLPIQMSPCESVKKSVAVACNLTPFCNPITVTLCVATF